MSSVSERSTVQLILQTLERKDRFRLLLSLVLILVSSLLEMASLGLVIPVVQTVISGDRRAEYEQLPEWLERLSYSSFVQLLMASLVIMFIVKNAFVLVSGYLQQRIQLAISNRLVQRLFETYLRQPYEFHLVNSSSLLVRNVQDFSGAVVGYGVAPIITIITDVATGIALFSVLVVVQPMSTVILLAVFALCGYSIVAVSRSRSRRWGAERVKHRGIMMEMLLGGLGGVKEIQLFGRDQQVVETHRASLYQAARSFYMFNVLQSVPRAAFEVVAVAGVSALVIVSTIRETSLQDTTLVVALFGVVAFRMLPSVNRIIQASQQFSYGRTALEGAVVSLALPNTPADSRSRSHLDPFRELRVSGLRYRYPNTDATVADVYSLVIAAGESIGIVGESGSGKSTLVDLLIGILNPQSGTVSVNGRDIAIDRRYWQDRIGYVPQHVYLMDTTIRRNVAFGLPEKVINDEEVVKALRSANLWEFVCGLPNGLNTVVGERGVRLSGGQRQRLGIARALYGNPEVIVLDEATSALDTETEREIVESFREIAHDHTLIVVAHRTSTLAHCSRLIRLEKGRIVQEGTFEEVIGSLPDASDRGQ